jgi:5-methylcytosine-specific restriction endonuclease McrA
MSLHVGLDRRHEKRLDKARAAALRRDEFRCRACGVQAPDVGTHLWRQPLLLPSYRTENLVSLCAGCHEAAHAIGQGARSWE